MIPGEADPYELTAREAAEWPLYFAPAACAGCVAIVAALAGALAAMHARFGALPGTALVDAPLTCVALAFAGRVERPRPWQFGLRPTSVRLACRATSFAFAAVGVATTLYLALRGALADPYPSSAAPIVAGVLLAPAAEEFFFRGFVYGTLRRGAGVGAASVATTAMFVVAHGLSGYPSSALPPIALVSLASCLVYERTGSIYPCIALHVAYNAWLLLTPMIGSLALAS